MCLAGRWFLAWNKKYVPGKTIEQQEINAPYIPVLQSLPSSSIFTLTYKPNH
ncbi:hypothetical protein XBI1_1940016 [Xenorhabdus bovienii str. Intermedium]|uniref:Uncharacterized protein n=1 Tax=Xenorhabdus bovienii str. Intermedium TaxID=1379677 RepID=A0A077QH12_XENBV|nr:hypothetical protein XBI1_1940016 [Xenorhabdus bovienii str. Intermedium]